MSQGTFDWRASSYPGCIQNYFLLKHIFDFVDNCDKCRKPGFLRDNIYTSCISIVLLDHFANKSNTFQHSLSPFLSLSLFRSPISSQFLLGSPLPPIPDSRIAQLKVPWAKIRYFGAHDIWQSFTSPKVFYSTELFRICSSFKDFPHLKSIFLNALLKSLLKTVYMT